MDESKYMIIDKIQKGKSRRFITSCVSYIKREGNKWMIRFVHSNYTYSYRLERIAYFDTPTNVNLEKHSLYVDNVRVSGAVKILCFSDSTSKYYHVILDNGSTADYDARDVYLSRTTLEECGGSLMKYLERLADETGLIENDLNILRLQYNKIDPFRDNVPLAQFLTVKQKLTTTNIPPLVIYPFSCNKSQKLGVENALTNQVSIVQGPPGTGKTQTILNIISNILLQGKTVLVVSNNNSAVENVAEKMSSEKIQLGFLVAKLGKKENKEHFIENQPGLPDMSGWFSSDIASSEKKARKLLETVSKGFKVQNELAVINGEKQSLETESRYNSMAFTANSQFDSMLKKINSKWITALRNDIERHIEMNKKQGILFNLKWMFRTGIGIRKFLQLPNNEKLKILDNIFYESRLEEISRKINECKSEIGNIKVKERLNELCSTSLEILHHRIAERWKGRERTIFTIGDLTHKSRSFLREYPVVLSTTYSCKNCISENMVFDYVIMDEASQVDITTGALALSCATNAVIVGDDKQLPNVIDIHTMRALNIIEKQFKVDDRYKCSTHSFLQSCCEAFADAPQTLLREHYRCHPKIIEFCNKMFYDGELITMTDDNGEPDVICVKRTSPGQHARYHYNQREIDVIRQEILPAIGHCGTIGIISPYREQAKQINIQFDTDIASTVHKYQGRECDSIIMSITDNEITPFADDANLLNVAVSRAKNKLCVVVSGNDIPSDSNIGTLIAYARYNNFEVGTSCLHSVFDILYKQYTNERLAFEKRMTKDLGVLSENVIYDVVCGCLKHKGYKNIDILCHYPLYRLVANMDMLSPDEKEFAGCALSHLDFLLYNTITKRAMMCIEVDGWQFHSTDVQKKRDALKDSILDKMDIKHVRLSTLDMVTEESIYSLIDSCAGHDI